MKNLKKILFVILLLLLLFLNLPKLKESLDGCPTQSQLDELQRKNDTLNNNLEASRKESSDNQAKAQDAKLSNVKSFCEDALEKLKEFNKKLEERISEQNKRTNSYIDNQ